MSIIRVDAGKTADIRGEIAVSRRRRSHTRAEMQISKGRSRIARIVGVSGCRRAAKIVNLFGYLSGVFVGNSRQRIVGLLRPVVLGREM